MLSSNFFLCAVISWTHVLLSRFHNLNIRHLVKIFEDNKVRCIPDAAVVAATDKVEAVLVHGEAGHGVQVGHLTINNNSIKLNLNYTYN